MKTPERKRAEDSTLERDTIEDFSIQWQKYDSYDYGYYGTEELFADITYPFLKAEDVKGRKVAEIGSGTGRIVLMLLDAGAERVMAIEPSSGGMEVLKRNTAGWKEKIEYLQVTGDRIPGDSQLDYVFSIGVIHHIPDPYPTLKAAFKSLKTGGKICIWVYGHEGNEAYLFFVLPLRKITSRLPHSILSVLSMALLPPLWIYIKLCRVLRLPMRDYMINVLGKLSPGQLRVNIYDQLNPAYAKYYRRAEVVSLLEDCGFKEVSVYHRQGYSWTAVGTKFPQEP